MIEVTRDRQHVQLKVFIYPISYYFTFSNDCGSEWAARAIYKILNEALRERIQGIRLDEYESGLKDARKKKSERKNYFRPTLEK